jgi:arsenate reductase-like glutaredoxin family protein
MVQIIGTKKSNATKKAFRYFSERNIDYQFVDLSERRLSAGELENIARSVGDAELLLDTESKTYKKRGMQYMTFDVIEELEEHPDLLIQPIVRLKPIAVLGEDQNGWEEIAEAAQE